MSLLSNVLGQYDAPQKAKELGVYPYFRPIESDQDTVVTIKRKTCSYVRIEQLFRIDKPSQVERRSY